MKPNLEQLLQNPQALEALAQALAATGQRPPPVGGGPPPGVRPQPSASPPPPQGGQPLNIGQLMNPIQRPIMPRETMTPEAITGGSLASLINPQGG